MLSLRALARASAPRTLGRLAVSSARRAGPWSPLRASPVTGVRAALYSSGAVPASAGELNQELAGKLESEMVVEEDMRANEQQPASIQDFLDNAPFKLEDTPGQEVVRLVRSFGKEKITVSFSISDLTANYDSENYKEDPALEDEEVPVELASGGKGGARSAAAPQQQQQQLEEEDELDEDELGEEVATPINLHIVVEKPGQAAGAMSIDAVAHDGQLNVENVWYHADAQEARSDDAPLRSKAYLGPPFGSLDEDLQVLLERFLEERGIGQAMAIFVPDYVNAKEQREYLRWLADVKTFVEA